MGHYVDNGAPLTDAMVSRDCGTRCVVLLTRSSRAIHDRAMVRVDGTSGGVIVLVTKG